MQKSLAEHFLKYIDIWTIRTIYILRRLSSYMYYLPSWSIPLLILHATSHPASGSTNSPSDSVSSVWFIDFFIVSILDFANNRKTTYILLCFQSSNIFHQCPYILHALPNLCIDYNEPLPDEILCQVYYLYVFYLIEFR